MCRALHSTVLSETKEDLSFGGFGKQRTNFHGPEKSVTYYTSQKVTLPTYLMCTREVSCFSGVDGSSYEDYTYANLAVTVVKVTNPITRLFLRFPEIPLKTRRLKYRTYK